MKITADTRPIALLGHPVEHSLSPLIHNIAFEKSAQPFVYVAADVREGDLPTAIRGLGALGFRGANVTIPHKRAAMELMDEVTPQAVATRAINTITCERGPDGDILFVGDNTDVTGFIASLQPMIERVMDRPALVIGSGGAARAVVYALATTLRASRTVVAARSPEKAQRMVSELALDGASEIDVVDLGQLAPHASQATLVVNATPVGMHPDVDATPISDASVFSSNHLVYDLIYRPRRTRLLREAADRGATVVDGTEMLLAQAAAAFARWTGVEMPLDDVRGALQAFQD